MILSMGHIILYLPTLYCVHTDALQDMKVDLIFNIYLCSTYHFTLLYSSPKNRIEKPHRLQQQKCFLFAT